MTLEREVAHLDEQPTASEPSSSSAASPLETWLVVGGGVWLLLGLFIDGYAHSEIIDTETEDFFTPWHAIFYSGFAASAAVVGWMAARRLQPGQPLVRGAFGVLPSGYRPAAIGLVIFAVGGAGDAIWHTIFGVETSIDALLSPTHLVLLTGLVLVLSAPLGAAWRDRSDRRGWSSLAAPIVSTTLVLSLIVFFLNYAYGLTEAWPMQVRYTPRGDVNGEFVSLGLSMSYLATVTLVSSAIVLLRRWHLPRGALVAVWATPVVLVTAAFGGSWVGVPAALIGAATVELVLVLTGDAIGRAWSITVALGVGTFTMWSAWMLFASWEIEIVWQAELWTGLIAMNALLALGLSAVALAPAPTVTTQSDE